MYNLWKVGNTRGTAIQMNHTYFISQYIHILYVHHAAHISVLGSNDALRNPTASDRMANSSARRSTIFSLASFLYLAHYRWKTESCRPRSERALRRASGTCRFFGPGDVVAGYSWAEQRERKKNKEQREKKRERKGEEWQFPAIAHFLAAHFLIGERASARDSEQPWYENNYCFSRLPVYLHASLPRSLLGSAAVPREYRDEFIVAWPLLLVASVSNPSPVANGGLATRSGAFDYAGTWKYSRFSGNFFAHRHAAATRDRRRRFYYFFFNYVVLRWKRLNRRKQTTRGLVESAFNWRQVEFPVNF